MGRVPEPSLGCYRDSIEVVGNKGGGQCPILCPVCEGWNHGRLHHNSHFGNRFRFLLSIFLLSAVHSCRIKR